MAFSSALWLSAGSRWPCNFWESFIPLFMAVVLCFANEHFTIIMFFFALEFFLGSWWPGSCWETFYPLWLAIVFLWQLSLLDYCILLGTDVICWKSVSGEVLDSRPSFLCLSNKHFRINVFCLKLEMSPDSCWPDTFWAFHKFFWSALLFFLANKRF